MTGETMWEVEHVFGIKESAETQRKGENHIRDIFLEKKKPSPNQEKLERRRGESQLRILFEIE